MTTRRSYDSKNIKVLEGLDAVRMRPGMYIGSTGSSGLHHMLWEIVDNAIDEVMGGFADTVDVTINKDSSVTVADNGRGMPVDNHPQLKVSGVQVIFTKLHAGGKFDNDNYAYSGGLHGVGASVVNALSSKLTVHVHREGKLYMQEFTSRPNSKGKVAAGKPTEPLKVVGKTFEKGSRITFLPDDSIFDTLKWNRDTVVDRLKVLAFLNRGMTVNFVDNRDIETFKDSFKYEGGIADFAKYLNEGKTPLHSEPIVLFGNQKDMLVEIAIQYTDSYTDNIVSFVNNIPTTNGGTHEMGFKIAVTKVMNAYARKNGLLKEKNANLRGDDYREGMTAIITLKLKNVQFEGQTKTKLGNADVRPAMESIVTDKLSAWMDDLKNSKVVNSIMDKAIKSAKVRAATRKATELARKKSNLNSAPLVGKLSACSGRDRMKNELILVEGDSAGGSAKQGRDRRFQAILPLRGKPLNVEKKRLDAVLANEEYRSIITALGCGIAEDYKAKNLNYNKVIILADADQDGAHIRAILITFFFRYMRELVTDGHLYIGQPPLYRVKRGKKSEYVYDDRELQRVTKGMARGYTIQRYKGLGEMDPEQLWETTLNPNGRKLIRVTVDDASEADRRVTILMGDKVERRKQYITQYANFGNEDNAQELGIRIDG